MPLGIYGPHSYPLCGFFVSKGSAFGSAEASG